MPARSRPDCRRRPAGACRPGSRRQCWSAFPPPNAASAVSARPAARHHPPRRCRIPRVEHPQHHASAAVKQAANTPVANHRSPWAVAQPRPAMTQAQPRPASTASGWQKTAGPDVARSPSALTLISIDVGCCPGRDGTNPADTLHLCCTNRQRALGYAPLLSCPFGSPCPCASC